MKIIGESLRKSSLNLPTAIQRRLDSLTADPDWLRDMEAQDLVIKVLQKRLDNHYLLIRNAQFSDLEVPVPLILLGPLGIWLLYPSGVRGYFRSEGSSWERLGERSRQYRPERVNLITHVSEINRVFQEFLDQHGFQSIRSEPVLILTNPGVYVEQINPQVRIIQVDALERFVVGLSAQEAKIGWKESQVFINSLAEEHAIVLEQPPELILDEFALKDQSKPPTTIPDVPLAYPDDQPVLEAMRKVPFSSWQIIFLGCMVFINILLIAGFILVILLVK